MPYGSVTIAEANRAVQERLNKPKERIIPQKLRVIEELKKVHVHVFNVGPWPKQINTGSTGTFMIPGCPLEKPYVELLVDGKPPITAIMDELVIKSEDEYSRLEEDGREFAHAMLGEGRGQNPQYALTRYGCFVADGDVPTKEEVRTAKANLEAYCKEVYRFINDLWATDRKAFSQIVRPELHFVAAKILGLDNQTDSPWMLAAAPQGRVKCKMCGRVVDPDVAMCEGGHIVNQELYLAAMADQENVLAAAKPKAKAQ
jgi:hypothetical protein